MRFRKHPRPPSESRRPRVLQGDQRLRVFRQFVGDPAGGTGVVVFRGHVRGPFPPIPEAFHGGAVCC